MSVWYENDRKDSEKYTIETGEWEQLKVYEFGEQGKPRFSCFCRGTGCYWRSNFGKVIEPLAENIPGGVRLLRRI